jgi:hypothetical protein
MATPHPVRIARSSPAASEPVAPPIAPAEPAASALAPVDLRRNRAGLQRAFRLAVVYLVALLVLYIGFVLADRAAPGGTGPTATTGLLYFTAIASVLAIVGVLLALAPAARSVEVSPESVTVEEWTGRRRRFPPLGELRVRTVRRYPAGFLSSGAVEAVEVEGGGLRRTYQLEEGVLPERRPGGRYSD